MIDQLLTDSKNAKEKLDKTLSDIEKYNAGIERLKRLLENPFFTYRRGE
jgi:hypothetical protein